MPAANVEVLVGVLQEAPSGVAIPAVILPVQQRHVEGQVAAWSLESKLDQPSITGRTHISEPQVSPDVQEVGQAVEPAPSLGVCQRGQIRRSCTRARVTRWSEA